jgi:uncharacterized protein YjbI with pentapeptide repeats
MFKMLLTLSSLTLIASSAMADIYQWQWVDPADHSQGKSQSTTLCPTGGGVTPGPNASWNGLDLTQAYLHQANLSHLSAANDVLLDGFLRGADLTSAAVFFCDLSRADLTLVSATKALFDHCDLSGADFTGATFANVRIEQSLLDNANFRNTNLSNASINYSTLYGANFNGATINGLRLEYGTDYGFTAAQLYSTASYENHDISNAHFARNNMSGWNFAGQKANADFSQSTLLGANFAGADLSHAAFHSSKVNGADFSNADLTGADLAAANFQSADFTGANLAGADLSSSDLRGARNVDLSGAVTASTTFPDGQVNGFLIGLILYVHDFEGAPTVPIRVNGEMHPNGITVYFDGDTWGSTISFAPRIPCELDHGGLSLEIEEGVEAANLVGRTFRVFDWSGVTPTGSFLISRSPYDWDVSKLYTEGTVTLLPEPAMAWVMGVILVASARRRNGPK